MSCRCWLSIQSLLVVSEAPRPCGMGTVRFGTASCRRDRSLLSAPPAACPPARRKRAGILSDTRTRTPPPWHPLRMTDGTARVQYTSLHDASGPHTASMTSARVREHFQE